MWVHRCLRELSGGFLRGGPHTPSGEGAHTTSHLGGYMKSTLHVDARGVSSLDGEEDFPEICQNHELTSAVNVFLLRV